MNRYEIIIKYNWQDPTNGFYIPYKVSAIEYFDSDYEAITSAIITAKDYVDNKGGVDIKLKVSQKHPRFDDQEITILNIEL